MRSKPYPLIPHSPNTADFGGFLRVDWWACYALSSPVSSCPVPIRVPTLLTHQEPDDDSGFGSTTAKISEGALWTAWFRGGLLRFGDTWRDKRVCRHASDLLINQPGKERVKGA